VAAQQRAGRINEPALTDPAMPENAFIIESTQPTNAEPAEALGAAQRV
jgi:hypothetical protein